MLSGRKTFAIMILALLIASLAIVQPLTVKATSPRTITVPDDFPTIQEALGNATAGDTVYVRAGNYTIPPRFQFGVEIEKSVRLLGENPQTTIIETIEESYSIFGPSYGIVLYDGSEISGFTITGNLKVLCLLGNGRITNNIINLTATGYQAINAGSGTISSNIINCMPNSDNQSSASGTVGIFPFDPNGNTVISNNIISGFGTGIDSWSNGLKIFNNTLISNGIGVFIQRSPALLWGNNFESSNGCGLRANGGTNATYNWWGTNDPQAVSRAITTTGYDQDVYGKVFFEPYLITPNPQAMPVQSGILSPTPTPTVPELSWLTILPLLVAVLPFAVAKKFRKRK